ncbi:hypothetical protein NH340_JMT08335 [Sarcoptes scabiei]|nr:hypothetical protein NH340_JMT08335 [Sarcoptes scabiei]
MIIIIIVAVKVERSRMKFLSSLLQKCCFIRRFDPRLCLCNLHLYHHNRFKIRKSYLESRNDSKRCKNGETDSVKLLLIGLDNAGKTTLALHLRKESTNQVIPTIGFTRYELNTLDSDYGDVEDHQDRFEKIILYDVGGGSKIRGIWKNYYALVHGFIFVVDSIDLERFNEIKELLLEMVSIPNVIGKSILIFLNKEDAIQDHHQIDLLKLKNIEDELSKFDCPIRIQSIAAQNHSTECIDTKSIDPKIVSGLRWLLDSIQSQWPILNERVKVDTRKQIALENELMSKRITSLKENKKMQQNKTGSDRSVENEKNRFFSLKKITNKIYPIKKF